MTDLPSVEATKEALDYIVSNYTGQDNAGVPRAAGAADVMTLMALGDAYVEGRLVEAPTVDRSADQLAEYVWQGLWGLPLLEDIPKPQVLAIVKQALSAAGVIPEDTVPGDGSE